ncbi:MAG: helix-turn-helix domain-containing protein [Bacillota bacterium]|jgi:hypothetical protein
MKKKASQNDLVLAWIKAYGSITTLEAFQGLGITRLSARIHDLKESGHSFSRETVQVLNRAGDKCRVTKYKLVENGK